MTKLENHIAEVEERQEDINRTLDEIPGAIS